MKNWKAKTRKKAVFCVYVIFWEQSGQAGVENGAMLTTFQIYFRTHHFIVKFSKFSSPQAIRGHWPPNQNPADVPGSAIWLLIQRSTCTSIQARSQHNEINWTKLQFTTANVNSDSPTGIHVLRTKRPIFATAPSANRQEVGRDADALDQLTLRRTVSASSGKFSSDQFMCREQTFYANFVHHCPVPCFSQPPSRLIIITIATSWTGVHITAKYTTLVTNSGLRWVQTMWRGNSRRRHWKKSHCKLLFRL